MRPRKTYSSSCLDLRAALQSKSHRSSGALTIAWSFWKRGGAEEKAHSCGNPHWLTKLLGLLPAFQLAQPAPCRSGSGCSTSWAWRTGLCAPGGKVHPSPTAPATLAPHRGTACGCRKWGPAVQCDERREEYMGSPEQPATSICCTHEKWCALIGTGAAPKSCRSLSLEKQLAPCALLQGCEALVCISTHVHTFQGWSIKCVCM